LVTPDRPIEQWVGRWVVVHAGFALEELDVAAAKETLTWIDRLAPSA
jgi:hydrogenase maturation factor